METSNSYLLPSGFQAKLPQEAEKYMKMQMFFSSLFSMLQYQNIITPLAEFAESNYPLKFLSRVKKQKFLDAFQLLDPASKKNIRIRSDITPQIADIIASFFDYEKVPHRVFYFGEVMKANPSGHNLERAIMQGGLEYITNDEAKDYDVVLEPLLIGLFSLEIVKMADIAVSFCIPDIIFLLIKRNFRGKLSKEEQEYKQLLPEVISKKSFFLLDKFNKNSKLSAITSNLLKLEELTMLEKDDMLNISAETFGKWKQIFTELNIEKLSPQLDLWVKLNPIINKAFPSVKLRANLLENGGFYYQNGLSFSIYGAKTKKQMLKGGCYNILTSSRKKHYKACGFSFNISDIITEAELQNPNIFDAENIIPKKEDFAKKLAS